MNPEKLGKYRLLQLLATGGMGEVFLARQDGPAGFSKTVVIKRILRHLATDQSFVDMFVNEARLAGQLQHPNIVQIFELGHEGDDWFIAMEYVHGRSLHAIVEQDAKTGARPDPRIAARVCAQALQGLQFAHQLKDERGNPLGILHRDVSPDNVLVSFSGGVKLVDFGIAKAMNASQVTRAGTLKGKFGYMAPEQFNSNAALDARTDLYAMGVTLHELLFNERPPCVPDTADEARKPRLGFTRRHELHASLNDVLERALYPNPKDRFGSAEEMAHALEAFITMTGESLTHTDADGAGHRRAVGAVRDSLGRRGVGGGVGHGGLGADDDRAAATGRPARHRPARGGGDARAGQGGGAALAISGGGSGAAGDRRGSGVEPAGPHGRAAGGGDAGAQPHQGEAREARGAPARRRAPGGGSGVRHG
ncbi:MAG: serine/threonine protein kinase [Archangiaceae bacterium]|nr:serine/threonine protein kinase [Archangiaceae bacterium]